MTKDKKISKSVNAYDKTSKRNKALKITLLSFLVLLIYAFSVYLSGFYETNKKLLTLVFFAILGFLLFFIVYYILYFITFIAYKAKLKKRVKKAKNSESEFGLLMANSNYTFVYDSKLDLFGNLKVVTNTLLTVVGDVSKKCGSKGKYYYLSFTSFDALAIVKDVLNGVSTKVDGIFKLLRIQNKPIGILEKKLSELVEEGGFEEKPKNPFLSKVVEVGIKAAALTFRKKLESSINDIISYVGLEAFKLFSDSVVENNGDSEVVSEPMEASV